jgi:ubiquinone/menaquinone biosynthesis C-methylase UbiE
MLDPKERFSSRVDDYVRYRPGYPAALYAWLAAEARLDAGSVVVDVGSGTGILSRGLLESGSARVVAVEPNAAMRAAAERSLAGHPRFESVDASAEATGLPDASADLVIAAQAFHWFDPPRASAEFARILRPTGLVALVWNQRSDSPQNRDYLAMLERFAPEYALVRESERSSEAKMRAFFAPAAVEMKVFENAQRLDEAGFIGRLLSSSYAPQAGHPSHAPMLARAAEIFRAHAAGGLATIDYRTVVWHGRLHSIDGHDPRRGEGEPPSRKDGK